DECYARTSAAPGQSRQSPFGNPLKSRPSPAKARTVREFPLVQTRQPTIPGPIPTTPESRPFPAKGFFRERKRQGVFVAEKSRSWRFGVGQRVQRRLFATSWHSARPFDGVFDSPSDLPARGS